jgi:DNA-binding PadR family transcriptional regulator
MDENELLDGHRQELRRGSVVLASLLALQTPGYGYGLLDALEHAGIPVAANTLYPLLRRLESQGLLTSEWDTTEARPRKFYRTSQDGNRLARTLGREWQAIHAALARLDPESKGDDR